MMGCYSGLGSFINSHFHSICLVHKILFVQQDCLGLLIVIFQQVRLHLLIILFAKQVQLGIFIMFVDLPCWASSSSLYSWFS